MSKGKRLKRLLHTLVRGLVFLATVVGMIVLAAMAILWVAAKRDSAARPRHEFAPTPWPPQSGADSTNSPSAAVDSSIRASDGEVWTREEIRELRDTLQNDVIVRLMQSLRDTPDAPVNFHDVVDATPRTAPQVRADFSKLSRISRSINNHTSWPLESAVPTDGKSQKAYRMPAQYLDWWFED